MTNALEFVLAKFPDKGVKIIDLYDKDEDFRILCNDYLTSVQTLEQFRTGAIKKNDPYEEEFIGLNQDLEKEIMTILNPERKEW
jgi:hypothetical protein